MLRNEGRESQSRRVQPVLELKDRTVWAKYTQQAVFFFIAASVKDIGCQRGQRSEDLTLLTLIQSWEGVPHFVPVLNLLSINDLFQNIQTYLKQGYFTASQVL